MRTGERGRERKREWGGGEQIETGRQTKRFN